MQFRSKMKEPNFVMRLGMIFLVLAMLANRFLHPMPVLNEGVTDGFKGLLYGLSIGLLLFSIQLRGRRCSKHA